MSDVHLRPVGPDNVRAACAITLKPGQERFVAPVAESLAEAYAEPEHAWPRLIYDGDTLVGFVMGGFHRTEPMFRSVLWRLAIAADHQGHGYGSFAVRAVAEEARRRGHERLVTYYRPGDGSPERFYRNLGFEPTGELGGEIQAVAPIERLL
jgi:diamine N-acetyltransferase